MHAKAETQFIAVTDEVDVDIIELNAPIRGADNTATIMHRYLGVRDAEQTRREAIDVKMRTLPASSRLPHYAQTSIRPFDTKRGSIQGHSRCGAESAHHAKPVDTHAARSRTQQLATCLVKHTHLTEGQFRPEPTQSRGQVGKAPLQTSDLLHARHEIASERRRML
jgi:uncharacterized protein affecting Mg2+/Co2+ transport